MTNPRRLTAVEREWLEALGQPAKRHAAGMTIPDGVRESLLRSGLIDVSHGIAELSSGGVIELVGSADQEQTG